MDRIAYPNTERDYALELGILNRELQTCDISDVAKAEALLDRIEQDKAQLREFHKLLGRNA